MPKRATAAKPKTRATRSRPKAQPKAKAKPVRKVRMKRLSAAFADVFDRMKKNQAKARIGRLADEEAKALRDELLAAMGTATRAKLADGRVIERFPNTRHLQPLPAKTIRWETIAVVEQP